MLCDLLRLCRRRQGRPVGAPGDQFCTVCESFRPSGQRFDQMSAENRDPFLFFRFMDQVGQFVGIGCQVEVLFLTGLGGQMYLSVAVTIQWLENSP